MLAIVMLKYKTDNTNALLTRFYFRIYERWNKQEIPSKPDRIVLYENNEDLPVIE